MRRQTSILISALPWWISNDRLTTRGLTTNSLPGSQVRICLLSYKKEDLASHEAVWEEPVSSRRLQANLGFQASTRNV